MKKTSLICALLFALVFASRIVRPQALQSAQAQDQNPAPIRSDIHVVLISVAVRDTAGLAVPNLHKEDFTVASDGKPRDFQLFPSDDSSAVARPVMAGNFYSNRFAAPAPRVTAILMDSLNTPMSDQSYARQQAIKAVQSMPLDENIGIFALSTKFTILQDYTTDRDLLLKALEAYTPSPPLTSNPAKGSSAPNSAEHGAAKDITTSNGPAARAEDAYFLQRRTDITLATLLSIATHITGASHRNSILWITSGIPIITDSNEQVRSTLDAINDSNIALYPIDARGLSPDPHAASNDLILQGFAQSTGGQAYYNRNDLDHAIEEAMVAPRSTYLLGFYLTNDELDGKFHELRVEVNRPGVTLSYRSGYTASVDPNKNRTRKEPLDSELLATQDSAIIGIDARLAPGNPINARGGKSQKSLNVFIALDRTTLTRPQSGHNPKVELSELFAEIDPRGQTVARISENITFDMPTTDRDPGYTRTIPLEDGAEKLKVIIQEKSTGRTGSLTIPLATLAPR